MNLKNDNLPQRKPNLSVQVYQTLKKAIMDNTLKPGEPLLERQLAESLGVSRTPVREAFKLLAMDGLVKLVPNREAEVADISIMDVKEIIQIRSRLETLAARLCTDNATPDDIGRIGDRISAMEESLKNSDYLGYLTNDLGMHSIILACSANLRLEAILKSLGNQISRLTYLSVGDVEQAPQDRMLRLMQMDQFHQAHGFGGADDLELTNAASAGLMVSGSAFVRLELLFEEIMPCKQIVV